MGPKMCFFRPRLTIPSPEKALDAFLQKHEFRVGETHFCDYVPPLETRRNATGINDCDILTHLTLFFKILPTLHTLLCEFGAPNDPKACQN